VVHVYDGLDVRASSIPRRQDTECTPHRTESLPESNVWRIRNGEVGKDDRIGPSLCSSKSQERMNFIVMS
jgi:hypothetical protein